MKEEEGQGFNALNEQFVRREVGKTGPVSFTDDMKSVPLVWFESGYIHDSVVWEKTFVEYLYKDFDPGGPFKSISSCRLKTSLVFLRF